MVIRIIIWVFGLFVLSRIILNYERKKLSVGQFILWVLIWILVVGFSTWPYLTDRFAHYLGIRRGLDAAIYISIILIYYLVFRIYVKLFDIESEITEIVKGVAIKDIKNRNKK